MIGYHYTTMEAWEQIQEEGLQLRPLVDSPFPPGNPFKVPKELIWLFEEPARDGPELRGQVFFTIAKHGIMHTGVVELAVEYDAAHLATFYREIPPGHTVEIAHEGNIGVVIGQNQRTKHYHVGKRSIILGSPVEPARITLLRAWEVITPVKVGVLVG